jgi:ABC-type sugar transport system ATPase subunit
VTHDQVEAMTLGQRVAVLHRGRLQQLATPRELYRRPANLFVAGFIGSPPMNLLPARVEAGAGGGARLCVAGQGLPLPAALAAPAAGEASLTAGVRPEALRLGAPDAAGALRARVLHLEYLGHEVLVHLALGPDGGADAPRLVARLAEAGALAAGDPVGAAFDADELHLFDARGEALRPPA